VGQLFTNSRLTENTKSPPNMLRPKAAIVSSVQRRNSGRSLVGTPSISQIPPMATALA
jgi:hypothetical protein